MRIDNGVVSPLLPIFSASEPGPSGSSFAVAVSPSEFSFTTLLSVFMSNWFFSPFGTSGVDHIDHFFSALIGCLFSLFSSLVEALVVCCSSLFDGARGDLEPDGVFSEFGASYSFCDYGSLGLGPLFRRIGDLRR